MMDTTATLIGKTVSGYDDFGNAIYTETETAVLCELRSVTRAEFYSAARAGLKPEAVLRLTHSADYNGEEYVRIHGEPDKIYSVARTYSAPGEDAVELTLQEKIGNG